MKNYQTIRLQFERKLYSHDGALSLSYDPNKTRFYIEEEESEYTIMTSYGPNPWGLVRKEDGYSETTFTDDILQFLIHEEKPSESIAKAILHFKEHSKESIAA